jgi:hypothetical protein
MQKWRKLCSSLWIIKTDAKTRDRTSFNKKRWHS